MLTSKDLRKQLTVLAVGSSLLAGCSSGPELRFTRFWPGGERQESSADDEAVAAKWRSRVENKDSEVSDSGNVFDIARAEQGTEEEPGRNFNIFRRFSRRDQVASSVAENPASPTDTEQQRQALERRIAELEAEQRAILQQHQQGTAPSYQPNSEKVEDPFLAAAQQYQSTNKVAASENSAPLPAWAQGGASESAPVVQTPVKEVAAPNIGNAFAPGFEDTLRDLQTSAASAEEVKEPAEQKAPTMPIIESAKPTIAESENVVRNPFVESQPAAEQNPFAAPVVSAEPDSPEPKLDTPIVEPGDDHPLAPAKSAAEQQKIYARLEVQQLMKRSRIQARAGQFQDALTTALSAEQLANSAGIEFALREQTPAQLISLIRMKSSERQDIAAAPQPEPAGQARLNLQPSKPVNQSNIAVRPSIDTESPLPQWPGRDQITEPKQYVERREPVATTTPSVDRQFKTAEFLNPRPTESVSPGTTSGTQEWYTAAAKPVQKPVQKSGQGGFMELRPSTTRSNSNVKTHLISSSHIYSPENLQWTKLDASLATLREDDLAPMPAPVEGVSEKPVFVEDQISPEVAVEKDIFAEFDSTDTIETPLESDAPLSELAPVAPSKSEAAAELTILGIPARKLGLVGLAGLILLAAIYHRRRTQMIHDF